MIHVTQLCSSCLCNKGTTTNSHQQRVCKQVKMFCLHMEQPHVTSTVTTRKANSDILDNIKITLIGLKCRSIKKGRTSKLESQHNDSIERKTLQIKIKSSKNFKKFIILLQLYKYNYRRAVGVRCVPHQSIDGPQFAKLQSTHSSDKQNHFYFCECQDLLHYYYSICMFQLSSIRSTDATGIKVNSHKPYVLKRCLAYMNPKEKNMANHKSNG